MTAHGRHVLTALLLAGSCAATAHARGDDPCATARPDERTRSSCARALYGEREYVAAARQYERLWQDHGTPKYLYNAAAAREAAGHLASALALWTRYEASAGVEEEERAELRPRLEAMRVRLVATTVVVTPDHVLGPAATFSCERSDGAAPESFAIPAALVADITPGSFTLHLAPGAWTLRLSPAPEVPEFSPVGAPLEVRQSPGQILLPVSRGSNRQVGLDAPERDVSRLTLGLGGAAGGVALLGIVVLAVTTEPPTTVDESLRNISAGSGLLGAAIGLGAAAGLETLPATRRRHRLQLGAGGAVAFAGLLYHLIAWGKFQEYDHCPSPEETEKTSVGSSEEGTSAVPDPCASFKEKIESQRLHRGFSAAMLGAGAALIAGTGLSHLVRVALPQRRQRRHLALGGLVRPHAVGLTLTGRF